MLLSYANASRPSTCRASGGDRSEERLLAHLLRTAATSPSDPFQSLSGVHPVDVLLSKDAYELRTDAPGLGSDDITVEVHEGVLHLAAGTEAPSLTAPPPQRPSSPPTPPASHEGPAPAPAPTEAGAAPTSAPTTATPGRKVLRRERAQHQRWSRSFLLPENADADAISVRLERGVLTVTIPVCPPPPQPQPRRIPVTSSSH